MKTLIVILHNIRSTYNVGAILRTCDGLGVSQVFFTGYTPHPAKGLPHEQIKIKAQIHKTALGAEETVSQSYHEDITKLIFELKNSGHQILALEQSPSSIKLGPPFHLSEPSALILGEEVHGITTDILQLSDQTLEIPMHGQKESFNVSVAAAIAIWELMKFV